MKRKERALIREIEAYHDEYVRRYSFAPTLTEIAVTFGVSRGFVQRVVRRLCDEGAMEYSGEYLVSGRGPLG